MSITAMKQALEALEQYATHEGATRAADAAITALRQAIEQAKQQKHVINCPRCGHCCPTEMYWGKVEQPTEAMRITRDGIWVNPDMKVDEVAQTVLDVLADGINVLVTKAVDEERERCAQICDSVGANAVLGTANECARAIRGE